MHIATLYCRRFWCVSTLQLSAISLITEGYGHSVNICDINNDGWKDIYVTNDFISNDLLWINNHNGTFSDKLSEYFKHTSANAMGTDIVDVNNDGWSDVVVLDMNPEDNFRKKMMMMPIEASKPWTGAIGKNSVRIPARNNPNAICTAPEMTPTAKTNRYVSRNPCSVFTGTCPSQAGSNIAPATIAIIPAAGPLIVNSELLNKTVRMPPNTAVMTPAIGGNWLAPAMPKQSGRAMRNTKNPLTRSDFQLSANVGKELAGFVDPDEGEPLAGPDEAAVVDMLRLVFYELWNDAALPAPNNSIGLVKMR